MRGRQEPQVTMLAFVDLEERVPADHPLRAIKALADEALAGCRPSSTGCTPTWGGRRSLPSAC